MDGSFGPEEQVLWPASVLAGVVMCAVVSSPRSLAFFFLGSTSTSRLSLKTLSFTSGFQILSYLLLVDEEAN